MVTARRIAVIIPYYQKREGLLSEALKSVFAQTSPNVACIIVVDDGSPHPATAELRNFSASERSRITLIEQKNAGVSAARNKGIDSLPPDVDLVAFLDPDDCWSPNHVSNAIAGFELGATFYFSDFRRTNSDTTRFERSRVHPDPAKKLKTGENLYRYEGDVVFDMVRSTMIGTSNVIMQRDLIGNHRFPDDISASEDLLFWATCLFGQGDHVIFSTNCEAICCSSDGLISSVTWGSNRSLEVIYDKLRILHEFANFAAGNSPFQDWVFAEHRRLGHDFYINARHRALHLKLLSPRLLVKFIQCWLTPLQRSGS